MPLLSEEVKESQSPPKAAYEFLQMRHREHPHKLHDILVQQLHQADKKKKKPSSMLWKQYRTLSALCCHHWTTFTTFALWEQRTAQVNHTPGPHLFQLLPEGCYRSIHIYTNRLKTASSPKLKVKQLLSLTRPHCAILSICIMCNIYHTQNLCNNFIYHMVYTVKYLSVTYSTANVCTLHPHYLNLCYLNFFLYIFLFYK